jgi:hypothetical protein
MKKYRKFIDMAEKLKLGNSHINHQVIVHGEKLKIGDIFQINNNYYILSLVKYDGIQYYYTFISLINGNRWCEPFTEDSPLPETILFELTKVDKSLYLGD